MIMYDNQLKTKEKKILTKDKIDSSVQSVRFSPIIVEKTKRSAFINLQQVNPYCHIYGHLISS